jgi:transposase
VCLVGCPRFVYNRAPPWCLDADAQAGTRPTYNALAAALTQPKRQLDRRRPAEVDSQALQQALRDLERTSINFFAERTRAPGSPASTAATRPPASPWRVTVDEATGMGIIPKVGAVRFRLSRPWGAVKSATVRPDACGDWWVSPCPTTRRSATRSVSTWG